MVLPAVRVSAQDTPAAIFEESCARCHGASADDNRAPDRDALRQQTPEAILDALTTGSMTVNARQLSADQRRVFAEFLAGRALGASASGDAATMPNRCPSTPLGNPMRGPRWNGWGRDLGNSRFQPEAVARLTAAHVPAIEAQVGLRVSQRQLGVRAAHGRWRAVYIGANAGVVYALDAETGWPVFASRMNLGQQERPRGVRNCGRRLARGSRDGVWAHLMKEAVANLDIDDMVAMAAYAASREP